MQAELGDENAVQAHSESLDDAGHGPEQLEQDGDHEFGDANDSDHDYHVSSLDADLDTGAFNSSREQGLRTQMFGDYVPEDQIEYGQDQGYQIPERRDQDQEQRAYVAQPEDYEEEEDDDDDDNDGDDGEDEDGEDEGDDAQKDGQYASVEAHGF
ncbi:hypothetical protein O6H91_12G033600 [Diphasiastrum complanatum]|uniref:Uncharacterized protein n=1 Tax=Diphasiastrum complanatum TaxID=34168 RepID=A0ACC2C093_DIPCM|nr:hypothetical protein O6H91_12G033600 [Diphasiastrum complanatum]